MTTWFTSDLHFGHRNIIKYCRRPFGNVELMDAALVENWNRVVQPDDVVWNLGDLAFCCSPKHAYECFSQLNGEQHFIMGNHDSIAAMFGVESPGPKRLASWYDGYAEVEVEGQKLVLCHYAMREWHHALRGVWHLFGHTHGCLRPFGKSVDVGVDNVAEILGGPMAMSTAQLLGPREALYRPVSFAEVKAFMDTRPIGPHAEFENFNAPSTEK